jgi:hypothetical protein
MRAYRLIIVSTLGLLLIIGLAIPMPAATPKIGPIVLRQGSAQRPISLRDRLIVGLEARLKSEIAFCEEVTLEVKLGHLPIRMVDETFLWAREKSESMLNATGFRPIIYFQFAMRARAARINVDL